MAGAAGVEPTSAVLETVILPLNYAPMSYIVSHYIKLYNNTIHFLSYSIIGGFMIVPYTTKELDLIARLMRAEAVGEGDLGMLMVGNVIVNRVLANCLAFKNLTSVTDVIYQNPGGFAGASGNLFNSAATTLEKELANRVLLGEYYYPATNALWFYAPSGGASCIPYWYNQKLAGRYKSHCFYQPDPGVCAELH